MKTYFINLLLLLSLQLVNAQDCKCQKEFDFVVNYYEENLPGFKDNVNSTTIATYNQLKNKLRKQAKQYCNNEDLCYKTLLVYVEFFKDNHSSIYTNKTVNIDESTPEALKKFHKSATFKNRELISTIKTLPNKAINAIENQYQTKDSSYTVAIIKNKNNFRDYVGVIVASKTALWKKGQVKFELKKVGENTYDMFAYMRNHSLRYYKNVRLTNGVLNDIWYNTQLKERKSYNIVSNQELTFKELASDISYISIPTFDGNQFAKISKFYKQHNAQIQSKPYLIIDVRNNGGGSDACVNPLLKYIYTKPFKSDQIEVYATKENIRKFEGWYKGMKKDTINFSKEFIKSFGEEISKMKSVPNKTFIPRSKEELISLNKVLTNPKKVVIITNKYCASSCETLLFWAMESDKTIIVGENSGGYVGYGEISAANTPNFNFEIGATITRYKNQRKYEVDGIPPQYYLNNSKSWIEQAIELLRTNK